MNADVPVSLYLVVPPSDIDRTRPLVRLMLNRIGKRLTESLSFGDKPAYQHRLLFMLDEFPSLGRLDFFQTALAYLAGYGIKAFLIAQSLNQLEATYGQNNSILDNCHIRMTYTALDDRTAKRISDFGRHRHPPQDPAQLQRRQVLPDHQRERAGTWAATTHPGRGPPAALRGRLAPGRRRVAVPGPQADVLPRWALQRVREAAAPRFRPGARKPSCCPGGPPPVGRASLPPVRRPLPPPPCRRRSSALKVRERDSRPGRW